MKKFLVNHSGQILAEVLVAIGIIIVVLIGMSSLMSKTTKTVRQEGAKDEAARLADAQIRWYKQQRDFDSAAFFQTVPAPVGSGPGAMRTFVDCNAGMAWSVPTPSPTLLTTVYCEVKYDDTGLGVNGVTITVRASWTEETTRDRSVSFSSTLMKP